MNPIKAIQLCQPRQLISDRPPQRPPTITTQLDHRRFSAGYETKHNNSTERTNQAAAQSAKTKTTKGTGMAVSRRATARAKEQTTRALPTQRLKAHEITPQQHDETLSIARYKPDTVKRYLEGIPHFLAWATKGAWPMRTAWDLDMTLSQYLNFLYKSGKGKHVGINLRCGVQLILPAMDKKLDHTDRALSGWCKLQPTVSHPPLTYPLTATIAVTMARNGEYETGVGVLVAFAGWLRISELTNLRASDVADGHDPRRIGTSTSATRTILAIKQAKTGRNQSVELKDQSAENLLREVRKDKKGTDLLFPGGPNKFRKVFLQACQALRLRGAYVPHSLRHGGATQAFMNDMKIEDILVHGRWKANNSARTYIQQSRSILLENDEDQAVVQLGIALAGNIIAAMHSAHALYIQKENERQAKGGRAAYAGRLGQ
jgi:Phage integrase family